MSLRDSTGVSDAYLDFLETKAQMGADAGFTPIWMPDFLFDFQRTLVEWACRRGRAAIFADCGLGKTPMQLVWAENVIRHTRQSVLLLTPLAVSAQTLSEGEKFGIACMRSRDGRLPDRPQVVIANYEQLHRFSPRDFAGVVCDESSILKHFSGATQKAVTRFMLKLPYRLLCTATAAPNDHTELGTSSEALGEIGYSDMLARFFRQVDDKHRHRMQDIKDWRKTRGGDHYGKLSYRVSQAIGGWRLKGHAAIPFWRWVASWARACRQPSDLGFSDGEFHLPALTYREHIITPRTPPDGMLFVLPAVGLNEERAERRRTLDERCEFVAELVRHERPAVVWCHLNAEGDRLVKAISGSHQVRGADSDEEKEEAYQAFASGALRVLVTKPKIGAWGLNWQHCAHVATFASHSYEQFYQSVRRCWRFGQTSPVVVDIVATEGEQRVRENMERKARGMDDMFTELVAQMQHATAITSASNETRVEVPAWLTRTNT